MDAKKEYLRWMQELKSGSLYEELAAIEKDENEINERFYRHLEFGTAGLRGIIAAGTNRMNVYTVGMATQGLAEHVLSLNKKAPSVAIAYDSRNFSRKFAEEACRVLAANNVKAYIYPVLMPTPALSFAVRYLKCDAGINITASHNPAEYNGYKAYGSDGCQITSEQAEDISSRIASADIFSGVKRVSFAEAFKRGLAEYISDEVTEAYLENVLKQRLQPEIKGTDSFNIVYTPLNGTGLMCVTEALSRAGYTKVDIVESQKEPDGNFPTCPFPNPEIKEALNEGLKICAEKKADILIATDPDCDRMGIAVPENGGFRLLSGNETGALIFDYICRKRIEKGNMPRDPICIKTIVTTDMVFAIAQHYGVQLKEVLTGFKYIGEQIGQLEQKGEEERYIWGFEESYGYLSGAYVRDKDGVDASLLICETALDYKNNGLSVADALGALYTKFGYYENAISNYAFTGQDGSEKMGAIMNYFRNEPIIQVCGNKIAATEDYEKQLRSFACGKTERLELPKSNVIKYTFENKSSVVVRPSGTEPKLKIYYSAVDADKRSACKMLDTLRDYFSAEVQKFVQ